MSTPTPADEPPIRAIDRFLGIGSLVLVVLSIVCFLTVIIATASGMKQEDFTAGAWPIVGIFPLWGLPIGFLMMIALLITSFVRRGRAARRS